MDSSDDDVYEVQRRKPKAVKPGQKKKRKMTAQQREALLARLAKAREAKKNYATQRGASRAEEKKKEKALEKAHIAEERRRFREEQKALRLEEKLARMRPPKPKKEPIVKLDDIEEPEMDVEDWEPEVKAKPRAKPKQRRKAPSPVPEESESSEYEPLPPPPRKKRAPRKRKQAVVIEQPTEELDVMEMLTQQVWDEMQNS